MPMKNTLFGKTTASPITTIIRFLSARKCHIILLGEIEELLKKLDTFCSTYEHVDCLYTLFKYRFSGKIIAQNGNVFHNVQREIYFNQQNRGVDKKPSIAIKKLLRKMCEQNFLSALQKNKSTQTQTTDSVFAEGIQKAEKTIFELDLIKTVDCFPDGHGSYDSNLVSSEIKSLRQTILFITVSESNESSQRTQNAS